MVRVLTKQARHPPSDSSPAQGTLHADAYTGFDELFVHGSVLEAARLAHTRRKFYDIRVQTTLKATEYIGVRYDIKAFIRGKAAVERLRIRQEKAK